MSSARRGGSRRLKYLFLAVVIPVALTVALFHTGARGPVIVIYGDSLTVQSKADVHQMGSDSAYPVVFRAYGGTALCDGVKHALQDRLSVEPERIVIAFTGNSASCVHDAFASGGAAAAVGLYEKSLREMRAIYPSVPITIVLPPAMHDRVGWYPLNGDPRLVAMYRRVGAELHMYLNADADIWLTPRHVFAQMRPDVRTGKLVDVRLSDGVHLTPAGARWYGRALSELQTGDYAREQAKFRLATG